jgi:hypothetical protein
MRISKNGFAMPRFIRKKREVSIGCGPLGEKESGNLP